MGKVRINKPLETKHISNDPQLGEGCPETPKSESEMGFERRDMVDWFSPKQLIRAGVKSGLSEIFGAFADRREIQAALAKDNKIFDFSSCQNDFWFDYVADLGDGFDSTYTVARALGQQRLKLSQPAKPAPEHDTPRGRLLIMGGDEVYPAASPLEYRNRTVGPYRAALPWVSDLGDGPPSLFAIPGNHDWYDGLTSFIRQFCQNRWIGGWKTEQERSYFAIALPHNWWLWGIDIQLESDIDQPQRDYFCELAQKQMTEGSNIILCTAQPTWALTGMGDQDAQNKLDWFLDFTTKETGHKIKVFVAGDLHTYGRWASDDNDTQYFVAGGGGAYLYPSHDLPEVLKLRRHDGSGEEEIETEIKSRFPSVFKSRMRSLWGLTFPFKNIRFTLFLGFFYLFFAWIVQSASKFQQLSEASTLLDNLKDHGYFWQGFKDSSLSILETLKHAPASVCILLLMIFGFYAFASSTSRVTKIVMGLVHSMLHLGLLVWSISAFATANLVDLGLELDSWRQIALFSAEMFLVGGLLGGGVIMAVYLVASNIFWGAHTNEVFLGQRSTAFKNFLRFKIDKASGDLSIFPVGIPSVPKDYVLDPDALNGDSWFKSKSTEIEDLVELIEAPINIAR